MEVIAGRWPVSESNNLLLKESYKIIYILCQSSRTHMWASEDEDCHRTLCASTPNII